VTVQNYKLLFWKGKPDESNAAAGDSDAVDPASGAA
jgi:hypothetical protein